MEKSQISLKKFNPKSGGSSLKFGESPESDWKIIFVSAAFLAVLLIALSVFIFVKIDKGEIFTVERSDATGDRTLNVSRLQETVSYYQAKAAEFERLKSLTTPAVDPSV